MSEIQMKVVATCGVAVIAIVAATLCCGSKNDVENKSQKQGENKKAPSKEKESKPVNASKKPKDTSKTVSSQKINIPSEISVTRTVEIVSEVVRVPGETVVEKGKKAKETPEQKSARLERQKIAKAAKKEETMMESVLSHEKIVEVVSKPPKTMVTNDGWELVSSERKKNKSASKIDALPPPPVVVAVEKSLTSSVSVAAPSTSASSTLQSVEKAKESEKPPAPPPVVVAVETITRNLKVEPRKIGVIIGPKGGTMNAIQDLSGAQLTMPKVDKESTAPATIIISSTTAASVSKAAALIQELCTKGYCVALSGEGFVESNMTVPTESLSDIIGVGGKRIKKLQDSLAVRVIIPPTVKGKDQSAKITISGKHDAISKAKEVIESLIKFQHHEITDPDVIHDYVSNIPFRMYNIIIGPKGSEIRHIQNNFKVTVTIPDVHSDTSQILLVGLPSGVGSASRYIQKIVQQAIDRENQADTEVNEEQDDAEGEEWESQYRYESRIGADLAGVIDAALKSKKK